MSNKKLETIGIRITSENKQILKQAAELTGQDLTSYMTSLCLEQARKDILEHNKVKTLLTANDIVHKEQPKVIIVTHNDFEKVKKEITAPKEPTEKLKVSFKSI